MTSKAVAVGKVFGGGKAIGKAVLLLALALLLVGAAMAQPADPLTVRVGVYENAPKVFTDSQGKISGIYPDIINAIAAKEGWNVQYVHGTWDEGLARLENNEIDVMVDVAVSETRQAIYDFNQETVLMSWGEVYTRNGVSVESFYDLEGKNVAVLKSGILYNGALGLKNLLDSIGVNAVYTDVKEYGDVFEMLERGEVDAGVVNQYFGRYNAGNYPNIRRTTLVFNPTELRLAFTKGAPLNPDLIKMLDADLRELKQDPDSVYYATINEYAPGTTKEVEIIPKWVLILLAGLCILIALLAGASALLRGLVEKRTRELRASEEKFRELFEKMPDPIFLLDKSGTVMEVSDMTEQAMGYARGEVVGKNLLKLPVLDAKGRALVAKNIALRLKGAKILPYYIDVRKKDGKMMAVEIGGSVFKHQGQTMDLVALRDVTERKELQEKLDMANQALRTKTKEMAANIKAFAGVNQKWVAAEKRLAEAARTAHRGAGRGAAGKKRGGRR